MRGGTGSQHHLADPQAGTLRWCLRQWVGMKQLQASDGAKATQLPLCQRKAGEWVAAQGAPLPPPHRQPVSLKLLPQWAQLNCVLFQWEVTELGTFLGVQPGGHGRVWEGSLQWAGLGWTLSSPHRELLYAGNSVHPSTRKGCGPCSQEAPCEWDTELLPPAPAKCDRGRWDL